MVPAASIDRAALVSLVMKQLIPILVVAAVLLAATWRLQAVWRSPVSRPDSLASIRNACFSQERLVNTLTLEPQSLDPSVTRVEIQCFDPDAVVLIQVGRDRKPGVAGFDDNRNGVVDDRSELGASYSDDVCSVATTDPQDENSLPVQYGAFVPIDSDRASLSQASQGQQSPRRAIIFGESPESDHWSFLVELDSQR